MVKEMMVMRVGRGRRICSEGGSELLVVTQRVVVVAVERGR